MPWEASREDWAKHPLDSIDLPSHPFPPEGVPGLALSYTDQAAANHTDPWHALNDDDARKAPHLDPEVAPNPENS